jgi:hypothetical protein
VLPGPSIRRRRADIAALAAVVATTAVRPDLTPLEGWISGTADRMPAGRPALPVALTARSNRVLRRNGLIFILTVRSSSRGLSGSCARLA